jgi:hypothetical protein
MEVGMVKEGLEKEKWDEAEAEVAVEREELEGERSLTPQWRAGEEPSQCIAKRASRGSVPWRNLGALARAVWCTAAFLYIATLPPSFPVLNCMFPFVITYFSSFI